MKNALPDTSGMVTVQAQHVTALLLEKLNLAAFQNAVPLLRELSIVNKASADLPALELCVVAVPPFLHPKTWRVDAVGAGKNYNIRDLDILLDGAFLSRLTESEQATVSFKLRKSESPSDVLARADFEVDLLPRNQWGGLSHLPDLIAAFVQPNEPFVEKLLKQAAEVLRKNGKNPALNGYNDGSQHAWELASGIWSAIAAMGLDYALPPASFEHTGQKIRGPAHIADSGLATCLDLAVLFCAALEQAGLNPLLIFTKGHAFAGLWLKAEEFASTVLDDVTALRKRIALKEVVLFETTVITHRPTPSFSYAIQLGSQQISEDKDDTFELAIDIRRARIQRIKPLASSVVSLVAAPVDLPPPTEPSFESAPDFPDADSVAESAIDTLNPKDRLARWQRKLLDLSMRNNLLNFKNNKKTLRLDAPNASAVEDLLAEAQALKLIPKPDMMNGNDPRNRAIHEGREHEDIRRMLALEALKRCEIFVDVPQAELETRLVDLYRTARLTLQEGGSNTLFLAMGFLSWNREDKPESRYRAPLVLIPVTLNRKSVRSGFTLTLHDDEPRFNPTLIEMLRQDFQLNLGIADGELPKDASGLDLTRIWTAVSHAVKDIKGWEVVEDVALAMFSFAKHLMWKDLTERTVQLRENAVVRHLMDTPRESYPTGTAFPNPKRLDIDFAPEQTFCPLPADSSQLSAVMAAVGGKDFVLIGPPGTGKSQTIANIIAQCLAEGKRVLFVSEKIAALDVVYRRLREVGLGEFCLELHSSKARKLDVLAQLQKSWEAQGAIDPDLWRAEAQRLKGLRDQLNSYVERLHFRHPNGMTIYEAIGRVVDGMDTPLLSLAWPTANAHSAVDIATMRESVDHLEVHAKAIGHRKFKTHPLAAIEQTEWSPSWQQSMMGATRAVITAADAVENAYAQFLTTTGLPCGLLNDRTLGAIAILARILPQAAGHDWRFVLEDSASTIIGRLQRATELLRKQQALSHELSPLWTSAVTSDCQKGLRLLTQRQDIKRQLHQPWPDAVVEDLHKGLTILSEIDQATRQLSVTYSAQVTLLNLEQLQRQWDKANKALWPASWLGKRKIRGIFDTVITGENTPDIAKDIGTLVRLQHLRTQIAKLDLETVTEGLWAGIKTKPHLVICALNFQKALCAAINEGAWENVGFEPITERRCGERLATDLRHLQTTKALDEELKPLAYLDTPTNSLWKGLSTQLEHLSAALAFQMARQRIVKSGALTGEHHDIARGACGGLLSTDFERLQQRHGIEKQLAAYDDLEHMTGKLWRGLATHIEQVEKMLLFYASISEALTSLAGTIDARASFNAPLLHLLGQDHDQLASGGSASTVADNYLSAWATLQSAISQLTATGHFSASMSNDFETMALTTLTEKCMTLLQAEHRMHGWCAWKKAQIQAVTWGLHPLVVAIENGIVSQDEIRNTFETNYNRWWLNAVVDHEPVIRNFVSAEHEKRIGDFRALDDRFTDLTRSWVRAELCKELPTQDSVTRNSEWGILRHEMNKKKRHMPLRELVTHIPTALTKLTPCLLMSPLSIAQYLAADATTFDVVVFDEASQIPVWDAIGAIARGKQVVMVGDPKQLPPTNFFDRAESNADEEDTEGDLESILDECLGANLPTMNLNWHYRSRHESLIAFSNHRYYKGSLITFPSPMTKDRAVSFHYVDGVYEKGGARTNQAEAKALVADLVTRLTSSGFRESKLTIGVVTFNTEQQSLIEDLLDEARRNDPSLESHFAELTLEPVFVKNLESVQGDERDIMYFAITYGPDRSGAISMNFGPMNREGGERRLNVAITRARHELRVFSTLKAEQIDLARTQSMGVRDLKHFMEFAERGPRALAEITTGSQGDFESPFEEAVATALIKRGWVLHPQVGASSFRIDLAVVHPDAPGIYLTGIECDGATYHRSATARDRDKLREQVLRGLGWEIVRIWSTDWWIDALGTLEKTDAMLHALLHTSRMQRAETAEKETLRLAALDVIAKAKAETTSRENLLPSTPKTEALLKDKSLLHVQDNNAETTNLARTTAVYAGTASCASDAATIPFIEADLTAMLNHIQPDAFYEPSYDLLLTEMITQVIDTEGPVLDSVLANRIARIHGWKRTGSRIRDRVKFLAAQSYQLTQEPQGGFYWPSKLEPVTMITCRRGTYENPRSVDEVCMQELVGLAHAILNRGESGETAIVSMARLLGLQALRATSRGRLCLAMQTATNYS